MRVYATKPQGNAGKRRGKDRDPILEAAFQEPVSFLGGMVAGFLSLDVKQDPLNTWVVNQASDAGIAYQAAKERLQQQQNKTNSS